MSYTKGPWTADCLIVRAADKSTITHTGGHRYIGQQPQPHEAEANARLIAAAPELLEALKAMLESADRYADGKCDEMARAAIAKAEETK